jgi:hypothetical protein
VGTRSIAYGSRWVLLLCLVGMVTIGLLLPRAILSTPLVAAALAGGVACVLLYARPSWGLYLVVALIPFQFFPMAFFGSDYTWSLAQLLVKFLFVVTVFRIIQSGQLGFAYSPLNIWIVLFMLVPLLSTLNAPDIRVHVKATIPSVIDLFLLYFVVVNNVKTKTRLAILVGVLLGTTVVVAGVGTLQYVLGTGTVQGYLLSQMPALFVGPGYAELRSPHMLAQIEASGFRSVSSIFVNPSDYGGFILYAFPLAAASCVLGDNPGSRIAHAALASLFGLNILLSLARSAWLGLAAALLLVLLVPAKRKPRMVVAAGVVAASMLGFSSIAGLSVSSFAPRAVQERALETISQGTLSTSWQTRVNWWEDVLTAISRSPLLGTGVLFKTHSQYFGLLLLFGSLGLGLHLLILGMAAHMLFTAYRMAEDPYLRAISLGACASLVGVSAHSLLWNDLFFVPAADMLFALFLGVAASLPRLLNPHDAAPGAVTHCHMSIHRYPWIGGLVLVMLAVSTSLLVAKLDFSPFDLFSYGALVVVALFVLTGVKPVRDLAGSCRG